MALLGSLLSATGSRAADVTVQSGPARTQLLELFTSEGCSSCPPAERWFSSLRQEPRLWKEIVPIAFHVDYWDGLGWRDPYASAAFTQRQRDYSASWGSDSVYTPGFVLNGLEWRGGGRDGIATAGGDAGKLVAVLRGNGEVRIAYSPPGGTGGRWQAHAALLGFGFTSDVKAGENSGRRLVHDFVVLALQSGGMDKESGSFHATLHLPPGAKPGENALAVWVTQAGKLDPVQAAGGAT